MNLRKNVAEKGKKIKCAKCFCPKKKKKSFLFSRHVPLKSEIVVVFISPTNQYLIMNSKIIFYSNCKPMLKITVHKNIFSFFLQSFKGLIFMAGFVREFRHS